MTNTSSTSATAKQMREPRELTSAELEHVCGGGAKGTTKPAEFVVFRLSQFSGGAGASAE